MVLTLMESTESSQSSPHFLMNSIVKKIEDFDNEFIHLKIFNILTNNGKLENFSHNRNGIFFELNALPHSKLQEIDKKLSYYRNSSDNAKENNKTREMMVDKMKKTVLSKSKEEDETFEEDDELMMVKAINEDNSDCSVISDSELFGDSDEELDEEM